jgi:hypothetical protein
MPVSIEQRTTRPDESYLNDRSAVIGQTLPLANYRRYGDPAGGSANPLPIVKADWRDPIIRANSTLDADFQAVFDQGWGVGFYNDQPTNVRSWADVIAQDWYGKNYASLQDLDKRAQVRAAIVTTNESAEIAVLLASSGDLIRYIGDSETGQRVLGMVGGLTSAGLTTAAGQAAAAAGTACGASGGTAVPACIAAALVGLGFAVSSIATAIAREIVNDRLDKITERLARYAPGGQSVSMTSAQEACRTIQTILDVTGAIYDATTNTIVNILEDPGAVEAINTANQILQGIEGGFQAVCEQLSGLEPPPLPDENGGTVGRPTDPSRLAYLAALAAYVPGPVELEIVANRQGSTTKFSMQELALINTERANRGHPGSYGDWMSGDGNGNGNGQGLQSQFYGIPVWAWLAGAFFVARRG